jgi:hypothetical protein
MYFDKPNTEIWKTDTFICKLYIQISNIHMSVVPGPASQYAVFKSEYALLGFTVQGGPKLVTMVDRSCSSVEALGILF